MPLSVAKAEELIREGARFGDVALLLPGDRERDQLREWFTRAEGVPANRVRPAAPPARSDGAAAARAQGFTGDSCGNCGGCRMVMAGKCPVCTECGTSGGCS